MEKCSTLNTQIFSAIEPIFFFDIIEFLTSKIMAKIFKDMKMKIMKTAKNMSQWPIAKKLWISRSAISESNRSFKAQEVFWINKDVVALESFRMVQKLISTVEALPKKTARQAMSECDWPNLVSVDITKYIFREHDWVHCS